MRSEGCLDESVLQELAAGIAPEGTLEQHGEHISHCDRCASILKRYLSIFSDEVTPEEQALISQLKSSRPETQRAIVRKMLRATIWKERFRKFVRWLKKPL